MFYSFIYSFMYVFIYFREIESTIEHSCTVILNSIDIKYTNHHFSISMSTLIGQVNLKIVRNETSALATLKAPVLVH